MAQNNAMHLTDRLAMHSWMMLALLLVTNMVPWMNSAQFFAIASLQDPTFVRTGSFPFQTTPSPTVRTGSFPFQITPSPTTSTTSPMPTTKAPSPPPTPAPSKLPTALPTAQPTEAPPQPTRQPSKSPSGEPSKSPTPSPTNEPTKQPTRKPSKSPSPPPTLQPTNKPTQFPTRYPSPSPTTDQPTTLPPTQHPSKSPSKRPSPPPTLQPTIKPTPFPTRYPSPSPTTDQPTTLPPTQEPSKHPSPPPTMQPTIKPTQFPSRHPSPPPTTMQPTQKPTQLPSRQPTNKPTSLPTRRPTDEPSTHPTPVPTIQPTQKPTVLLWIPTRSPTGEPTTKRPTMNPTQIPTQVPSKQPTEKPTISPTAPPSRRPTIDPTSSPTKSPSVKPSRHPTNNPSLSPSWRPTQSPSESTKVSTSNPTLYIEPSCLYDRFGVEKVYLSGNLSSNDWYMGSQLDGRTSVSRNGAVHIDGGIATLQGSPRLEISTDVSSLEFTGYANYPTGIEGSAQKDNSGFNMAVIMSHPTEGCAMPSYRMRISLEGVASFQKEYRPNDGDGWVRSRKKLHVVPEFEGQLPTNQWIGIKFIVRSLPDRNIIELYLDLHGGEDITNQHWRLVHWYVDSGSWMAKGDSPMPQDTCASSLGDGAVLAGRKVYAVLENAGNSLTEVLWRSVSIRSISSTSTEIACTSVAPTTSPTVDTALQSNKASSSPSRRPSISPTFLSIMSTNPTEVVTEKPTAVETKPPSSDLSRPYTIVRGTLNFKLQINRLLKNSDEITTFEVTVSDFLQKRLSLHDDIEFSGINATIVSQTLISGEQSDLSTPSEEPVRVRSLEQEGSSLLIQVGVNAVATPSILESASTETLPFQTVIHRILSENSRTFYDELFQTPAFGDLQSSPEYVKVDLESQGGGDNKTLALGSSIAGIIILLSLAVAFFVMQRRNASQAEEEECDSPPEVCAFGQLEEGDGDMSSLDDSLLVDKYPNNVPHLPGDLPSANNDNTAKDFNDQQIDSWSLDDTFPLKQNEDNAKNAALMPQSCEPLSSSTSNGDVATMGAQMDNRALGNTFPLRRSEDNNMIPPSQMTDSDDSTAASSTKAELKQDSFIPRDDDDANKKVPQDEEEQSLQSDEADDLRRLYEKAMVDESVDDEEAIIEEGVQAPTPRTTRGLKMFSCFHDNTFEEQTLTTQRLLGKNYRSDATPKMSNTKVRGNVYEVRAPPGPLGILIESGKRGPIVHEVKEGSPLLHLVEPGDLILTVDGVDCRSKDAVALAKWISTKPQKPEQVLTLMGSHNHPETTENNDDGDMSV